MLYQISQAVTLRRISDASRTFENVPIPFVNPCVDSEPYSYFLYTPVQTNCKDPGFTQPWGSDSEIKSMSDLNRPDPFLVHVEGVRGCECLRCDGRCPCSDSVLTWECGPSCGCELGCGNRVTQGGVSVKLKIVKGDGKGWGLRADAMIPSGTFVCEYAGELLTTKEARKRQQVYDELQANRCLSPALLVVKEHLPSGNACIRINIDGTRVGNVARFINHSCDGGNLDTVIVRSSGALLPRICFFASRDIQKNEELAFSYGDVRMNPNGRQCFCGSSSCTGFLPSELT